MWWNAAKQAAYMMVDFQGAGSSSQILHLSTATSRHSPGRRIPGHLSGSEHLGPTDFEPGALQQHHQYHLPTVRAWRHYVSRHVRAHHAGGTVTFADEPVANAFLAAFAVDPTHGNPVYPITKAGTGNPAPSSMRSYDTFITGRSGRYLTFFDTHWGYRGAFSAGRMPAMPLSSFLGQSVCSGTPTAVPT